MANNHSNDENMEKEVSEEPLFFDLSSSSSSSSSSYSPSSLSSYSPSSPSSSSENEGGQDDPVDELGGVTSVGQRDKGKASIASLNGVQRGEKKRRRERNTGGHPGTSNSTRGGNGYKKKPRKKGDLSDPPKGIPTCYVCSKVFNSWKGLFGHMRAHLAKDGRPRGAFPPPVFTPPPGEVSPKTDGGDYDGDVTQDIFLNLVVPALLNIAQAMLLGAAPTRPDGLVIDLNQPAGPNQEEGRIDLNEPARPEEEEDNDNGDKNKDSDDGAAK